MGEKPNDRMRPLAADLFARALEMGEWERDAFENEAKSAGLLFSLASYS